MPFQAKSGKFNTCIQKVEMGCGAQAIKIGGENTLPLYFFDAAMENPPKIGIEITDLGIKNQPDCIRKYYENCETISDIAKRAASFEGVDFLCFRMEGGDPNGENKPAEELIKDLREAALAVSLPIVVDGCHNDEKDAELLVKAAKALEGKNALFLSAKEENYERVEEVGLGYNQILGAESSVDINLAKQLNVLLIQSGVDSKRVVMNVGSACVGYGFEYVVSTMERIKLAALSQNDMHLQMPIMTPVSTESWEVKESIAPESDMPEWGNQEERGIHMEIETAVAVIASGSNAVILRHPQSVQTVSKLVKEFV